MNAALRAIAVLADPAAAWARIEEETADAASLLSGYVSLLALIPVLANFIGACLIGVVVPDAGTVRTPIFDGLFSAVFGYVATFAQVLIVAFALDVLAPLFGGRRNFTDATKLTVYSFTPAWLAGFFLLLPGLNFLMLTGFYGAYLLAKGLPPLMKTPEQKALPCAAIVVVLAGILMLLTAAAQRVLFG